MVVQLETLAQHQPAVKETYCGATLANIDELKRLISMDVKLTRLLLDGKIAVEQYDSVYSGYENRFEGALELKDMHLKRFQEDLGVYMKKLEAVEGQKELLEARREIGDTQEDSYLLKKRAIDWDLTRLQEGVDRNQRCIMAILQLPEHVDPGDVSMIEAFMRDSLGVLKKAKLDGDTKKKLRNRIKRLAQLVNVA
jgi:hypothetical protein